MRPPAQAPAIDPSLALQDTRAAATDRMWKKASCGLLLALLAYVAALPASLLEDTNQAELRVRSNTQKEVDAQSDHDITTEAPETIKDPSDVSGSKQPLLYSQIKGDTKTVAQYEKGYLYGAGKAGLDKHVENALLKTELYGEPSAVNQYRYYGGSTERSQELHPLPVISKRSERLMAPYARPMTSAPARLKRELEMDPEEVLALLSLWQAEHHNANPYRSRWSHYGIDPEEYQIPSEADTNDLEEDDDQTSGEWLDGPTYPAVSSPHFSGIERRSYYYPPLTYPNSQYQYPAYQYPIQKKSTQWGGFSKDKRFMVSRKRQAGGDVRYLAQLLGPAHHDSRVPLYHRVVL